MTEQAFVWKDQKNREMGYTTGSCAAAAAKSSSQNVALLGEEIRQVSLMTPKRDPTVSGCGGHFAYERQGTLKRSERMQGTIRM